MNKYIVEFLGTLFLVFIILTTGNYLAIGAALAIAITVALKISGGNFNPAVTIALVIGKKMPFSDMIPYILSQVAGGLVALELYKKIN